MPDFSLHMETRAEHDGPQRVLLNESLREGLGQDLLGPDAPVELQACASFEGLVARAGQGTLAAVVLDCRELANDVAALRVSTVRRLARRAALLCVVRDSAGVESVLEAGADDAVADPWLATELRARVRARVRERRAGFAEVLRFGPLEFVLHEARAMVRGQVLSLRRAEYGVLLYLAQQEGRPVTAGEILNDVLGTRGDGGTVRNHIMALRRALTAVGLPHFICTERGRGYRVATSTHDLASQL